MSQESQREYVDTIIFSDIHIGSPLFEVDAFQLALERYDARQIIGNGDIFDHSNFKSRIMAPFPSRTFDVAQRPHRLPESHMRVLAYLNERNRQGCAVHWITGNHDDSLWRVMAHFLEPFVSEEHSWEYQGKRFVAIHGDQLDSFYHTHRWISEIATFLYGVLQNMGSRMRSICAFLKSRSKHYTSAITHVADGAALYAAARNAHHVFCGHTHHAEQRSFGDIGYYNSGCWTQRVCSFITIGEQGIRIHYFDATGEETHIDGPYAV